MFDVAAISAALATSSNPGQVLAELDDEEIADLRDETENPELMTMLDEEIARRRKISGSGWGGKILWLIVVLALIGSMVAVSFQ